MKHKAIAAWQIVLIIFIILVVLFGLYLGLAWILRLTDKETSSSPSSNQSATKQSSNFDQALVGTWESDCWVPNPSEKWASQEKVTITKDGIANSTKYSYENNNCTTTQPFNTLTMKFQLETPVTGQVNMKILEATNEISGSATAGDIGKTIYDIYQVSGNNLKIAFGYRPATGGDGTTEASRQTSLDGTMNFTKK